MELRKSASAMNDFSLDDDIGWYASMTQEIRPMLEGGTVLLIGTGSTRPQYVDWPDNLINLGAKSVSYLEAWKPYIDRWAGGPHEIIYGEAAKATEAVGRGSFDLVMFNHGIEHVALRDVGAVSEELFSVCRRGTTLSAPYGGYYDYQEAYGGNPWERHVIKSPDPSMFPMLSKWSMRTFGNKGAGNATIWWWRRKMGQYGT